MTPSSTHFDPDGNARMVDITAKSSTIRVAVASGRVQMMESTAEMIRVGQAEKGDVLGIARIAAIQATKWTSQLIPLCHAIPIEAVSVEFRWLDGTEPSASAPSAAPVADLQCTVRVQTTSKTGVEMEAMTAVSAACLTIYDMAKSVDRAMQIGPIQLEEKSGGKSGHFRR